MSADGGHFEPRSGSLKTILEVDHLRTIDDMFAILAYSVWETINRLNLLLSKMKKNSPCLASDIFFKLANKYQINNTDFDSSISSSSISLSSSFKF